MIILLFLLAGIVGAAISEWLSDNGGAKETKTTYTKKVHLTHYPDGTVNTKEED